MSTCLVLKVRALGLFLAICALGWGQAQRPRLQNSVTGRVVSVQDGDTITLLATGRQVRIRLHGIDCPERGQPFTAHAKRFTSELTFSRVVTAHVLDIDRYQRLVAEVILPDGRNLNHEIVRAGFAWWFQKYAPGDRTLEQLEAEARQRRRGLWADAVPVQPWEWRRRRERN